METVKKIAKKFNPSCKSLDTHKFLCFTPLSIKIFCAVGISVAIACIALISNSVKIYFDEQAEMQELINTINVSTVCTIVEAEKRAEVHYTNSQGTEAGCDSGPCSKEYRAWIKVQYKVNGVLTEEKAWSHLDESWESELAVVNEFLKRFGNVGTKTVCWYKDSDPTVVRLWGKASSPFCAECPSFWIPISFVSLWFVLTLCFIVNRIFMEPTDDDIDYNYDYEAQHELIIQKPVLRSPTLQPEELDKTPEEIEKELEAEQQEKERVRDERRKEKEKLRERNIEKKVLKELAAERIRMQYPYSSKKNSDDDLIDGNDRPASSSSSTNNNMGMDRKRMSLQSPIRSETGSSFSGAPVAPPKRNKYGNNSAPQPPLSSASIQSTVVYEV